MPPVTVIKRVEIVDLPRDRIRRRICAVAAPAPVVAHHGEMRSQQLRELPGPLVEGTIVQGAIDQDQRRACADLLERDRRPIG